MAIALAVNAPSAPGNDGQSGVVAHLADRSMLLVLDNCEHLIEPISRIARLESRSPECRRASGLDPPGGARRRVRRVTRRSRRVRRDPAGRTCAVRQQPRRLRPIARAVRACRMSKASTTVDAPARSAEATCSASRDRHSVCSAMRAASLQITESMLIRANASRSTVNCRRALSMAAASRRRESAPDLDFGDARCQQNGVGCHELDRRVGVVFSSTYRLSRALESTCSVTPGPRRARREQASRSGAGPRGRVACAGVLRSNLRRCLDPWPRCFRTAPAGPRATSVGDDDVHAGGRSSEVLRQLRLQFAHSDVHVVTTALVVTTSSLEVMSLCPRPSRFVP